MSNRCMEGQIHHEVRLINHEERGSRGLRLTPKSRYPCLDDITATPPCPRPPTSSPSPMPRTTITTTTTTTTGPTTVLEITAAIIDSDRVSAERTDIVAEISISRADLRRPDFIEIEMSGHFDLDTLDIEPTDGSRAIYSTLTFARPDLIDAIERAVLDLTEIETYHADTGGGPLGGAGSIDAARADTHAHGCDPDDEEIGCICDDLVYLRVVRR